VEQKEIVSVYFIYSRHPWAYACIVP